MNAGALRVGAGIHQYTGSKLKRGDFTRDTMPAFGVRAVARAYPSCLGDSGTAFDFQLQVYIDFSFGLAMPKLMNI